MQTLARRGFVGPAGVAHLPAPWEKPVLEGEAKVQRPMRGISSMVSHSNAVKVPKWKPVTG